MNIPGFPEAKIEKVHRKRKKSDTGIEQERRQRKTRARSTEVLGKISAQLSPIHLDLKSRQAGRLVWHEN